MIHREAQHRHWRATPYEGIEICGLRRNDAGGGTFLVKVARGARVPMHDHPAGEEVYVLAGRARIGDITVDAGDYLWTPPNGVHDLRAEEDTVLLVSTPEAVRVIE